MKIKVICLILMAVLLVSCATTGDSGLQSANPQDIELTTDKQKIGYATGFEQIKMLINENKFLDQQAYLQGMNDALDKLNPRLTPGEIEKLVDWQWVADADYEQAKKATHTVGQAFLEKNKHQKNVKTLPSGLQYKVLVEGKGKLKAKITDTVALHYSIARPDGKPRPEKATKGKNIINARLSQLITGWQEALQLMTEGSQWQLYIPSELAFGEKGLSMRDIPHNETLVCDVDLVAITPATVEKTGKPSPVPSTAK
jgi:FKBP-type peptidyl-prolyl cis-trans isomerase FklB